MFTHDISKYLPSEFIPYSRFFSETNREKDYKKSDEQNQNFQKGWLLHQKRNKHHWNYWVSVTRKNEIIPTEMPSKHVKQMVADWRGMGRKFGGTANEYYIKNKDNMILHERTVYKIENII